MFLNGLIDYFTNIPFYVANYIVCFINLLDKGTKDNSKIFF